MTHKIANVNKDIYGGFVKRSKKGCAFYKVSLYLQVVRTNTTTLHVTKHFAK
jgi:hypothetical protein